MATSKICQSAVKVLFLFFFFFLSYSVGDAQDKATRVLEVRNKCLTFILFHVTINTGVQNMISRVCICIRV